MKWFFESSHEDSPYEKATIKSYFSKWVPFRFKQISWIIFWAAFLSILILIDTFFFKPLDIPHAAIDEPTQGIEQDTILEVSWLGPPNFAVGKEELWIENMLEARFNLELEPILLDPNAYQRKKPLMLAGGPVPDLIWEADPISLKKAVEHKFVAELPYDLIQQHMPEYYRDLTKEAPEAWLYSTVDGRNFGIPTLNRYGSQPSRSGVWRKDWLRVVGIEKVPDTLEEFEEALFRFRHDDPDQNGLQDTYGMSGDISNWWWTSFTEVFGAFGVTPFDWQVVNGNIVWGGVRPETKEALALLNKWYESGLIHPDFTTDSAASGQSMEQKFYAGKIGYINYKGTYEDMRRSISGSFSNNFLNLRLPEILNKQPAMAEAFLNCADDALLEDLATTFVKQLLTDDVFVSEYGRSNNIVQHWVLAKLVFNRFEDPLDGFFADFGKTVESTRERNGSTEVSFENLLYRLNKEIEEKFRADQVIKFRRKCSEILKARKSEEAIDAVLAGDLDAELRGHLQEIAKRCGIDDYLEKRSLFTVMKTYFFRALDEGKAPNILLPARPAIGPEGHRGSRAWGKPGNILAFGRQVAEEPEKAIRIMRMMEAMHTDIDLYWKSRMGLEGIHWDWWDPIEKSSGGKGFTLKPDFEDPLTGDLVDLQITKNAKRHMLHPSLGFYNLVAGKKEFSKYEEQSKFAFDETHLKEEWGLVNPLGKSDVVPSASVYLGDLRMRQQTFFAEVIRGSRSVSDFDEFVQLWHEKGGAILVKEANLMLADWKQIMDQVEEHLEN